MKFNFYVFLVLLILIPIGAFGHDNSLEMETLRVTAQKQEENLQDVSASVTLFTSAEIEDKNIDSITDIADYTPNFINFNSGIVGLYVPSIRGIHQDGAGGSPVGLFIDGVPVLSSTGFSDDLVDIERVEVLKGPQGSLYGSNTESGAINIITKQPGNDFSGSSSIESGEDNKLKFSANVKGPLKKDKAYISVSALHYEKDGYIKNTNTGEYENNRNYDYFKGILRFTPSDNLDISFSGSHLQHDDGDQNLALTKYGALMSDVTPPKNKHEVDSDLVGWNKSKSNMESLNINWKISDNLNLNSITTRREYRSHYLNDWDLGKADPMFTMHKEMDSVLKKYSQELRLNWTDKKNKFISGIYLDDDDDSFEETNHITGQLDEDHTTKANTLGIFLHGERKITNSLRFIAGLRFDKKTGDFHHKTWKRKADEDWSEFSPKLGLEYNVNENIMFYASASKGYRAGGFNEHSSKDAPWTYEEEKLISYEAGLKTSFFNKRILFNTSVYYMDIDDMQVRIDEAYGYNYTDNAGSAWSSGFESDLRAKLSKEFTLSGTFGYNRCEFSDYKDANGDYKGNKNPYAPDYTYSIDMSYRNHMGIFGNLGLIGYGSMYLNKENKYKQDPYKIVKAKFGYETERFDIYLYSDNLFDEEYDSVGYFGGFYTVYSPPRESGIKITLRF